MFLWNQNFMCLELKQREAHHEMKAQTAHNCLNFQVIIHNKFKDNLCEYIHIFANLHVHANTSSRSQTLLYL